MVLKVIIEPAYPNEGIYAGARVHGRTVWAWGETVEEAVDELEKELILWERIYDPVLVVDDRITAR